MEQFDILSESEIPYRIILNKENSGCVFKQWIKGLELARNELIWIAETDDSADPEFLAKLAPYLARRDVSGAFGHIRCVDDNGAILPDLDSYFDNLLNFSWDRSCVVPAYQAFKRDFVIRNVVPNASGFVFRKPQLSDTERERLLQYRFAGDWYFYALLLRSGLCFFKIVSIHITEGQIQNFSVLQNLQIAQHIKCFFGILTNYNKVLFKFCGALGI